MNAMNKSLEANKRMRRRGRGIFDHDVANATAGRSPFALPTASRTTRERFAAEARAHRRRERIIWAVAIWVTLLLAYAYYVYLW